MSYVQFVIERRRELGIFREPPITRHGNKRGCATNGIGNKTSRHLNLDIAADGRYSPHSPLYREKLRNSEKDNDHD